MFFVVKAQEINKMAAKEATNLCQNATRAHLGRCIDCEQRVF